jgi:hypothetical protein
MPHFAQTENSILLRSGCCDRRAGLADTRWLTGPKDLPTPLCRRVGKALVRTMQRTNVQKPIVPNGVEVNLFASPSRASVPSGSLFLDECN